jgi:hypothetical protein
MSRKKLKEIMIWTQIDTCMGSRQDAVSNGFTYKNPFDEGWRKNVKRVFTDLPWYRNLWPSLQNPPPPKYPLELSFRDLKEPFQV